MTVVPQLVRLAKECFCLGDLGVEWIGYQYVLMQFLIRDVVPKKYMLVLMLPWKDSVPGCDRRLDEHIRGLGC